MLNTHIQNMHLTEKVALNSPCNLRKVGAGIMSGDERLFVSNQQKSDDGNSHHAEIILLEKWVEMHGEGSVFGATLYVTCRPCQRCTLHLVKLGLKEIYYRDNQPEMHHLQRLIEAGVFLNDAWITGQVAKDRERRWEAC